MASVRSHRVWRCRPWSHVHAMPGRGNLKLMQGGNNCTTGKEVAVEAAVLSVYRMPRGT